jgi:hypothetical protein
MREKILHKDATVRQRLGGTLLLSVSDQTFLSKNPQRIHRNIALKVPSRGSRYCGADALTAWVTFTGTPESFLNL